MADLGQDKEALLDKIAETELLVMEKHYSKKKIDVAIRKLKTQKKKYEQSLLDIDDQILQHETDLGDLKKAYEEGPSENKDKDSYEKPKSKK